MIDAELFLDLTCDGGPMTMSPGSPTDKDAESPGGMPEHPETVVGLSTGRIEMFSDAVFAIVITLLVLQIQVPKIPPAAVAESLTAAILAMWPEFLSYAVSFLSVGIYWVLHHFMFRYIQRSDRMLLWLNLIFLMFVSFLPFPTALLGAYGRQPVIAQIYGLTLAVIGLTLSLIWVYATSGRKLVDPKIDDLMVKLTMWKTLIPPALYLLAVILSAVNTTLSMAIYILVPVISIWPGRIDRKLAMLKRSAFRAKPPIEVPVISDKNQSDESMRRQAPFSQIVDLEEESKR